MNKRATFYTFICIMIVIAMGIFNDYRQENMIHKLQDENKRITDALWSINDYIQKNQ